MDSKDEPFKVEFTNECIEEINIYFSYDIWQKELLEIEQINIKKIENKVQPGL